MNWTQHVIISLGVSIGQAAFGQTPILVRDYNPTPLTKVSADPDSIVMRVSGFGKVDHEYDAASCEVRWKVDRRLRHRVCEVNVQWQIEGRKKNESPMRWSFVVEREAAYQVGAGE